MVAGASKDIAANTATLPLFFSPDYLASSNPFDTIRKPGWVAASLIERPIPGVTLVSPTPLTATALETVHDRAFVRAVRSGTPTSLADLAGLAWDPQLWTSVCASNGGAVAAALHALLTKHNAGSLSCGLHHARRDSGAGFCTFNGLALAARAAIDEGAARVLILDLDAHCGGGTASIVADWPEVTHVDVAVSGFDGYTSSARQTLRVVRQADHYLATIARVLDELDASDACDVRDETRAPFDLVIYNAGMDPHEDSAIGGLPGITADMLAQREALVFDWARRRGVPVAFVLAGGYSGSAMTWEELVDLHRVTIEASVPVGGLKPADYVTGNVTEVSART